ncbi:MAG: hypothetical protein IH851_05815 [Armatimonadetes bacterium]|nr:hypothetical protein [Armatimonadota bacterium]
MFGLKSPAAVTFFGIAIASLVLAGLFARLSPLIGLLFSCGVIYFAAAGVFALRRDPYDLRQLRDVHEEEEVRKARMEETPSEGDSVYCPYCSTVYASDLPTCPQCGRSVNT